MLLSKSCEYGIRAATYVASRKGSGYLPIHVIGADLGISSQYLTKILQSLTQAGIMRSSRGPKGGVALGRHPDAVTLLDVIEALDGMSLFNECILGLPGCGEHQHPCPIHEQWNRQRASVEGVFRGLTLAAMASSVESGAVRIADLEPSPNQT